MWKYLEYNSLGSLTVYLYLFFVLFFTNLALFLCLSEMVPAFFLGLVLR